MINSHVDHHICNDKYNFCDKQKGQRHMGFKVL
jgi:hypothetical protein